jgi:hypothetical protein
VAGKSLLCSPTFFSGDVLFTATDPEPGILHIQFVCQQQSRKQGAALRDARRTAPRRNAFRVLMHQPRARVSTIAYVSVHIDAARVTDS